MTGGPTDTGTARAPTLVAAALLTVAGAASVAAAQLTHQIDPPQPALAPVAAVIVLTPGVVGLLILRHHPRHRVGWLLSLQSFLVGLALSTPPAHPSSTLGLVLGQVSDTWWVFFYFGLVLVAYVFPTGEYLSRRWRIWVIVCVAGYAGFLVGGAGDPTRFAGLYPGRQPPLPTLPTVAYDVLEVGGIAVVAASLVGAFACARRRLRGATGVVRLQMLWFSWAALLLPLVLALCFLEGAVTRSHGVATLVGISVLGLAAPALIGIAILRHHLFDIELVLSRTLVYASLTVAVIGVYAALLWGAERVIGNSSLGGLVAIGLVAVIVQPAHGWLRTARRPLGVRGPAHPGAGSAPDVRGGGGRTRHRQGPGLGDRSGGRRPSRRPSLDRAGRPAPVSTARWCVCPLSIAGPGSGTWPSRSRRVGTSQQRISPFCTTWPGTPPWSFSPAGSPRTSRCRGRGW